MTWNDESHRSCADGSIRCPNQRPYRFGLDYLTEFGRAAQLDDVRHRIQSSRHYPDMSEVRVLYRTTPHDLVLRVLTVFTDNDQTLVVCIGGDKAAWQRTKHSDWYDHAIRVA